MVPGDYADPVPSTCASKVKLVKAYSDTVATPRTSFHHQVHEFAAVMGSGMSTRCITWWCVWKVLLPSLSICDRRRFIDVWKSRWDVSRWPRPTCTAIVPRQELKGHRGSFVRCLRLVFVVRIGFWKNSFCWGVYVVTIIGFQPFSMESCNQTRHSRGMY